MKTRKIYPVILSGGSGTRLWPMSRSAMPKQFLPFKSDKTLFVETLKRVANEQLFHSPIIVGNKEHSHLIQKQLGEAGVDNATVILEPVAKNTAPAIALAAFHLLDKDPHAQMLVMPSDHIIDDIDLFQAAVEIGASECQLGNFITFGIYPDYPETGYGYIESGHIVNVHNKTIAFNLDRFVEKPNKRDAEAMLAEGHYYWNSGIFMFSALKYIDELARNQPDMVVQVNHSYLHAQHSENGIEPDLDYYDTAPSDSVDYAVMEHTQNAVVIEGRFKWCDAGSWLSLWDNDDKDVDDNVICGDVISENTSGCYIRGGKRLISTIGLEDLVVVDTDDALLIADKNQTQDVKTIVNELNLNARDEAIQPATVRRPWGSYTSIDKGMQHQVKHITVEPGGVLSKQYHNHRSEHWIVVSGIAEVEVGDQELILGANDSVYIAKKEVHRLKNRGKKPLHLIEVQCGNYLGEDDIVRLEDKYGRVETSFEIATNLHDIQPENGLVI